MVIIIIITIIFFFTVSIHICETLFVQSRNRVNFNFEQTKCAQQKNFTSRLLIYVTVGPRIWCFGQLVKFIR